MRRAFFSLLTGVSLIPMAYAEEGRHLVVTVYPSNLALVQDTRVIEFVSGRSTIGFSDVSAQIKPETAALSADGVSVIEQNFDFDLLTPQKLMEKALGSPIKIVRTNPGTGAQVEENATVLSTQQGVVLKVGDHVEVLRDDGVPTRVIFDKVPENLRARPTLSILAASSRSGSRPATLSYMTAGLTWKADYVAAFNEKAKILDLQGWVTLTNSTGVSYDNATVKVAVGALSSGSLAPAARPDGGANDRLTVFDLPEAVTIANRQAKQIGMADLKGIRAEKVYRSVWATGLGSWSQSATGQSAKAQVVLRFEAKDGSGKPWRLPRGALRAFVRDSTGDSQFIGEAQMTDIAAGGKIGVAISRAFDIDVTPRFLSDQKLGPGGARRRAVEYKVTNASDADATVEIEQGGLGADAQAFDESVPGVALDAYRRQWTVNVPARGETILTAVLEQST